MKKQVLLVGLALLSAACADSVTNPQPDSIGSLGTRATKSTVVVTVTPDSARLDIGGTVQLQASYASATGGALSRQQVAKLSTTYATSDTLITVTAGGLVTARSGGTAHVTATTTGAPAAPVTVTVIVAPSTVTTPPPTSPSAAECATPGAGWIFCDDFEVDRSSRYFETDNANGSFARTASVGVNGSSGMRAHFAAGQVNAGSLHLAFGRTPSSYIRPVDAGTSNYREIYWRVYVRNQAGWQGGGGDKLSRAQSIASSNWAQAMAAHVWSGGQSSNWNSLLIDPASGTDSAGTLVTTTYNDFANLRWLGAAQSATPIFDAAHVGQWYCVEAHVRLNDAGQANGTFDLWINGNAEASRSGLNWVGSFSDYGINSVYLENYWNNGSPVAQDRFMDNFVVSTTRIGC